MQGEEEGPEMEGEHPLGINTQLETSSSEQESSVERKGSCREVCETLGNNPPSPVFFLALRFGLGLASMCKHSWKKKLDSGRHSHLSCR